MTWSALPAFAAWRFVGAVDGFEVVYTDARRLRGHTTAVEDGRPYAVHYDIALTYDDAGLVVDYPGIATRFA